MRISTWPVASQTRTPLGTGITGADPERNDPRQSFWIGVDDDPPSARQDDPHA
ncbi:hypothetical protein VSX63_25805 [Aurantimonas sp. C2-4-R8]|nr:hypothetical protein [Aurantimonas sp. C2-4-R8]